MATPAVADTTAIRRRTAQTGDIVARLITLAFAASIILITFLLVWQLWFQSAPSRHKFGFAFLFSTTWNPVTEEFGALAFVCGPAAPSVLALLLPVPWGLGSAILLSERAPAGISSALTFL